MKLTEHFTLQEMTASAIAARFNLDNKPNAEVIINLTRLANLLEKTRALLNRPIRINSGYRSVEVNSKLGSKATSQHTIGCAADITVGGLTPDLVVKAIVHSDLPYDQVIREYDSWVHISIPNKEGIAPRKQALIIDNKGTRPYA
jgi:zinc D-Ala-D-Ala carboxypeptidase